MLQVSSKLALNDAAEPDATTMTIMVMAIQTTPTAFAPIQEVMAISALTKMIYSTVPRFERYSPQRQLVFDPFGSKRR